LSVLPKEITARRLLLPGSVPLAAAVARLSHAARALLADAADTRLPVLVRIEQGIAPVLPLAWLGPQEDAVRLYWRDRTGELELAGVGLAWEARCATFAALQRAVPRPGIAGEPTDLRVLFTARFDAARGAAPEWARFGTVCGYLPAVEMRADARGTTLACHVPLEPGAPQRAVADAQRQLAALRAPHEAPAIAALRENAPEMDDAWAGGVASALAAIDAARLAKVVLARRRRCSAATPLDAIALLRALSREEAPTFRFGVQLAPHVAFVGASPELLFRRRARAVESEALAGTRARAADPETDRRLGEELLHSAKERGEHELVRAHIASRLRELCTEVHASEPALHRLGYVQHLRSAFRGELAPGVDDVRLLDALHPTPAICGSPTALARAHIAEHEPFDRGLYGGPIGVIGEGGSDCAVAIRSALVQERELCLYSGAGIVAGSDARAEWDETTGKMRAFAAVLGAQ
jgi:menaquinone-specific isochorismate synthase